MYCCFMGQAMQQRLTATHAAPDAVADLCVEAPCQTMQHVEVKGKSLEDSAVLPSPPAVSLTLSTSTQASCLGVMLCPGRHTQTR
mgnify:CR=1 FL=1